MMYFEAVCFFVFPFSLMLVPSSFFVCLVVFVLLYSALSAELANKV